MTLTRRQAEVLAILKAATDGIAARAVAAQINLSQGRTSEVIRELRVLGLCEQVSGGSNALWAPSEQAAAIRERVLVAARNARLARGRAWEAVRRQRQKQRSDDECDFARPSIKRTVPAASCPPIKRCVPASVFYRQMEAA